MKAENSNLKILNESLQKEKKNLKSDNEKLEILLNKKHKIGALSQEFDSQ